jgi:hypothetical protein
MMGSFCGEFFNILHKTHDKFDSPKSNLHIEDFDRENFDWTLPTLFLI